MKPGPAPKYDRKAVLDAAMEIFWSRGYTVSKLDEILETTGIGRQSLYSGFGDKHSLYLLALEHYIEQVIEPRLDLLASDQSEDGLGGMRQLIEDWKVWASMPDRRGCLIANTSVELGRRFDEQTEAILANTRQRLEDAFVRTFERAKSLNTLSETADPLGMARVTMATVDGLSSVIKTASNGAAYGASTLDQLLSFIESA
ncbi:MAG: TetR/AcrR family transcriptional regulator [Henriciella sp.]|nr:TetR/AcrR family transcriptional regulator [Henriciella sp.]